MNTDHIAYGDHSLGTMKYPGISLTYRGTPPHAVVTQIMHTVVLLCYKTLM